MKKIHQLASIGLIAAAIFTANYSAHAEQKTNIKLWPSAESPIKDSAEFNAKLETILQKMTLEEKVGQIMQAEIQSVTPEDIKDAAIPVLQHRVIVTPEREMEGLTSIEIIKQIIESIEIPR